MATITELKLQKNKERANIYLDGSFVCGMELTTLVQNGLKVGSEVTREKLALLQVESEKEKCFQKAISLLERQKYTKKQIRLKLQAKGYLDEVIDKTIEKLIEYRFIDDTNYVESYIHSSPNKSKKEIRFNLMSKGVSSSIIDKVLDEEGVDEEERVRSLAQKYLKNKEKSAGNIQKMVAYLYRKGFEYGVVSKIAREFNFDEF